VTAAVRLVRAIAVAAFTAGNAALAAPTGDAARGEALYARCFACHSLEADRTGPRHCGLFGRRAGSVPGFDYSPAMRASGIVWDARTLDRFLAAPLAAVPGTSMGYAGIASEQERADLIAFLRAARCGGRLP
jgi:cytochrome c